MALVGRKKMRYAKIFSLKEASSERKWTGLLREQRPRLMGLINEIARLEKKVACMVVVPEASQDAVHRVRQSILSARYLLEWQQRSQHLVIRIQIFERVIILLYCARLHESSTACAKN